MVYIQIVIQTVPFLLRRLNPRIARTTTKRIVGAHLYFADSIAFPYFARSLFQKFGAAQRKLQASSANEEGEHMLEAPLRLIICKWRSLQWQRQPWKEQEDD